MNIFKQLWNSITGEEETSTPVVEPKNTCESKITDISVRLDPNLYMFAVKMQEVINSKRVASSDYTSRDLEKIDEDVANLNVEINEGVTNTSNLEVKIAARVFLLNNSFIAE
jgi:hypothetical protein